MPAATADPPAAPPAPKMDAAGVVPPAQLPASSIAPPISSTPPKPGSARERIYKDLEKYAKPPAGEVETTTQEPPPKTETKTDSTEPPKVPPTTTEAPPTDPKDKTVPPDPDRKLEKPTKDFWRAFDSWKDRAVKAETQLAEATKGAIPEAEKKSLQERIDKAEARAKELEDHIRFVDYAQHPEFKDKYQKPYEQAWERAMQEVSQIRIKEADGSIRNAGVQDLASIIDAPLMDARAMANQLFGEFADDVMAFRKEIRGLNAAQVQALEDAKKNGAERQKLTTEQMQRQQTQLADEIKSVWNKTNEVVTADPTYGKFFKPVDGDQEINQRLAKGFELVDRAFTENPRDPNLTPEQRASVVKRHAAVRNRAAAFGRLVYEINKAAEKIADLEKQLDGYKKSTPGTVGQPAAAVSPGTVHIRGMDRIRADLEKIAKAG